MGKSVITVPVREYLTALDLKAWYGSYATFQRDPAFYYLGIGEVGGIPFLQQELPAILQTVARSEAVYQRAVHYAGTRGELRTNELLSHHLNTLLGVTRFHEEHVVPFDGAHDAISCIVRACTVPLSSAQDRRHYVLLPVPSYPYFASIIGAHAGLIAFPAYTGEEVVEGIERYTTPEVGMILINVPNNPIGYTLSTAEQIERINAVADRYDTAIVVDIVYAWNVPDRETIRLLRLFDPERTILVDSFSKKYGLPGYRIGYTVTANLETAEALRLIKTAQSVNPSNVKLLLAAYLLEHYPEWPARIGAEIATRFHTFYHRMVESTGYGITLPPFSPAANTFYLPLFTERFTHQTGLSPEELARICKQDYRVITYPGTRMGPPSILQRGKMELPLQAGHPPRLTDPAPVIEVPDFASRWRPFLRISLGAEHRIAEAADRLSQAIQECWEEKG
ncbi:MAG: pyridoxal phosphate-dependent aminotransferase [Nitrospinota bacterium]|nr:MAG: pyridoxal phosphate-dependent aminotransferase [Nitrospinota bacterium]